MQLDPDKGRQALALLQHQCNLRHLQENRGASVSTAMSLASVEANVNKVELGHIVIKSVNSSPNSGEPEGWQGLVKEVDGHKSIISSHTGNSGFRYLETERG